MTVRLGFLYPGYAAEADYPWIARTLSAPVHAEAVHAEAVHAEAVHAEVVHTSVGEDAHRVDALLDLGSSARLLEGATELGRRGVDAAMWACTSGSFVFGLEGARRQVAELSEAVRVPWSSTSFAFVRACRAIGATRVAVAATYPTDVAQAFRDFLAETGIEVVSIQARDVITATEVGRFDSEWVHALVAAGDHPDADAVLVPDTALRTASLVDGLEQEVGKPVLTANLVTVWEALRLAAGSSRPHTGLGRLFLTTSRPAAL